MGKAMRHCMTSLLLLLALAVPARGHEIILDPGHSPARPGTRSCSGGLEYAYNNDLLYTVYSYLKDRRIFVEVTRDPHGERSLMERAAASAGKKLFVSLHHDAAQPQFITRVNGNPCSEKARGYSIFVSQKNPQYERSLACARVLGRTLRELGLQPSTHHGEPIKGENRPLLDPELGIYRFDDLVVLKHARSPAILLEAAVIIHPEDDKLARSEDFQRRIAEGVARAAAHALRNF